MDLTFSDFVAWLLSTGLPAALLVLFQSLLKRAGVEPAIVTPRAVAVAIVVLAGLVVAGVQFGVGIVLFPEITSFEALVKLIASWLITGQALFALAGTRVEKKIQPAYRVVG